MATTAPARTDNPGKAVTRRIDPDTPAGFRQQLRQNADKITLPQGISLEAFENVVFSATVQNPDLLKADRQSLLLACLKAAQDGLLPNGRDAALVTFNTSVKEDGVWVSKKLVQYMPMVAGLRSKILRAVNPKDGEPIVVSLQVGVVYKVEVENGYFRWERGTTPEVQHRPMLEISEEDAADENIVAAYSIAKFRDGTESCEVMRRFEIDKVRESSQTGATKDRNGKARTPKGPWVDWFPEMAKKTAMRRHSKVLPMAGDLVFMESNDEVRELQAADNAARILGSQAPEAPERLEDQRDETDDDTHAERQRIAEAEGADTETGEIVSTNSEPPETVVHDEEPEPRQQQRRRRPEPEPETREEKAEREGPESVTPEKTAAEVKTEELLKAFNRSETVIDLEKHKRELDKHRKFLEPDQLSLLDAAYDKNSDRLYGNPAK